MRIAAGAPVMTGLGLAVLVHPAFIAVSGFLGAGLVYAGITDFTASAISLRGRRGTSTPERLPSRTGGQSVVPGARSSTPGVATFVRFHPAVRALRSDRP